MRETSANEPLTTHRNRTQTTSKPECPACSGSSMEETYLLAMRCPVYRRRDSHPGFRTELENLVGNAKGEGQKITNIEDYRFMCSLDLRIGRAQPRRAWRQRNLLASLILI